MKLGLHIRSDRRSHAEGALKMNSKEPTAYPEINALLGHLWESVRSILGPHCVGMYLEGSLTSADFDEDSDIDFLVVTDEDVASDFFPALQAMHDRIAEIDSPWAIQLEGSYIPQHDLRRYDPAHALHLNIERGPGERLKMVDHDTGWIIHRAILRERGITLAGPPAHTLIDPVSPDDLRQAVLEIVRGWATSILDDPTHIRSAGYQSYTVLTLCRILYTLQHGAVVSKRQAAQWAQQSSEQRWASLIARAWVGRHAPAGEASAEDTQGTLDFIRYTLERSQAFKLSADGR